MESGPRNSPAEDLWARHAQQSFVMAYMLLGDEAAAKRAVALGMADFALSDLSMSRDDARRSLASCVYRRSREHSGVASGELGLPLPMVRVARLAQLQRSCLALCMFGFHTHKQASELLGISASDVAALLRSALQEFGRPRPAARAMAIAG